MAALRDPRAGALGSRALHGVVTEPAGESPNPNWHASNYWARHQPLVAAGVDTFWPDEGEFNSYVPRIARVRLYFDGPRVVDPRRRTYGLYRGGGFPGMQRYLDAQAQAKSERKGLWADDAAAARADALLALWRKEAP